MSAAGVFFCLTAMIWVAWSRNSGRSTAVYRASDLITARRWLRVAGELPRSACSQSRNASILARSRSARRSFSGGVACTSRNQVSSSLIASR